MMDWCHLVFHFLLFVHGFQVEQKFGHKFEIFRKCSQWTFGKDFGKLMCN